MPNSDFESNNGRLLCSIVVRLPLIFLFDEILQFGLFDIVNKSYVFFVNQTLFESPKPYIELSNLVTAIFSTANFRYEHQTHRLLFKTQQSELSPYTNVTDIYHSHGIYDSVWQILLDNDLIVFLYLPVINIIFSLAGCILILLICFMNVRFLVNMYKFLLSTGLLILSYKSHIHYIKLLMKQLKFIDNFSLFFLYRQMLQHGAFQFILGFVYWHILLDDWHNNDFLMDIMVPVAFAMPSLLSTVFNMKLLLTAVNATITALSVTTFTILLLSSRDIYDSIYRFYIRKINFFRNFGLLSFLDFELDRLQIPTLLRCFWSLRMLRILGGHLLTGGNFFEFNTFKYILTKSCDSFLMIISLSAMIGKVFFLISEGIRWILLTNEVDEAISGGMAILNFVLSLQTGLTDLDDEKRFQRLLKNFCLMIMAFLHCMHSVVNTTLMSLSVPSKPFFWRHVRALSVAVTLIIFPIIFIRVLYDFNEISTWFITLLSFGTECLIKYSISLIVYTLYLIDSKSDGVWEQLDDYVYFIHSFGSVLDFIVGVLLFFNGLWILIFERSSLIRALMMAIHVYQNIWKEAKSGWTSFRKRRTALLKVNSLKDATINQLWTWNDICAICFQDMVTAKVTTCNHYFHTMCLKKWLYVQDNCPLCHKILHALTTD